MKMSKCDRVKPLGVLHVPLGGEAEREEILDFELEEEIRARHLYII